MDRFEQLKSKYAPVLAKIQERGVSLKNLHVEQDKLVIRGAAPNDAIKNEVWDAIKAVDPSYGDLTADVTIDPSLYAPGAAAQPSTTGAGAGAAQTYTVQAGDTLSKISKHFYGDAKKYAKIYDANRDQLNDPDKIRPGQVLKIPAA
jgi:nucleoid-associated protein YgaU